jgi:hypothetical protein
MAIISVEKSLVVFMITRILFLYGPVTKRVDPFKHLNFGHAFSAASQTIEFSGL